MPTANPSAPSLILAQVCILNCDFFFLKAYYIMHTVLIAIDLPNCLGSLGSTCQAGVSPSEIVPVWVARQVVWKLVIFGEDATNAHGCVISLIVLLDDVQEWRYWVADVIQSLVTSPSRPLTAPTPLWLHVAPCRPQMCCLWSCLRTFARLLPGHFSKSFMWLFLSIVLESAQMSPSERGLTFPGMVWLYFLGAPVTM